MLTMDVHAATTNLDAARTAARTVTRNAQAAVTVVPIVPNPPDWYTPIQNDLKTTQEHAKTWLRTLCPRVNSNITTALGSFSDAFQSSTQQILDAVSPAGGGDHLTAEQRATVGAALSDLTKAIGARKQDADSLLSDVKSYFATADADQDRLQADVGVVAAKFSESGAWIGQMSTAMSETFLDSQELGPCNAIVNVNLAVSMQLGQIGTDPTLNTLLIAKAVLDNQIANFGETQQALEAVLDFWTTYAGKVDAVVADLARASRDADFVSVLTSLDVQTARDQWQQIADFVSRSITNPPSFSRPMPGEQPTTQFDQLQEGASS